jgi:hypothetical protein
MGPAQAVPAVFGDPYMSPLAPRQATGQDHKEMDSVGNSLAENARALRVTGLKARKKRQEYAEMERRGLDTTIRKYD